MVAFLAVSGLAACQYVHPVDVAASGCSLQSEVDAASGCSIAVHGTGIGYALDGWIERTCRTGRIRVLTGGRSAVLNWFAGARQQDRSAPAYIADCAVALAGPELFNQDFESFYTVQTTDEHGARLSLETLGLDYSDIVLPAWQAALRDPGQAAATPERPSNALAGTR